MFAVVITGPRGAGKTSVLTALTDALSDDDIAHAAVEPASWSGLSGLVEHAQELAVSMPDLAGVNLVVSTEGQRPEDVAARIRSALPVLVRRTDGGTLRT